MMLCVYRDHAELKNRSGKKIIVTITEKEISDAFTDSKQHQLYCEGELVQDQTNQMWFYIICDFLSSDKTTVIERLNQITNLSGRSFNCNDIQVAQFTIIFKQYVSLKQIKLLSTKIKDNIYSDNDRTTKNDGLIFTPVNVKTQLIKNDLPILKWKSSNTLTIDCSLNPKGQVGVYNPINKNYINFAFISDLIDIPQTIQPGIIEIIYIPNQGWKFIRERSDKSYANNFHTLLEIITSQIDNLDMETLIKILE